MYVVPGYFYFNENNFIFDIVLRNSYTINTDIALFESFSLQ